MDTVKVENGEMKVQLNVMQRQLLKMNANMELLIKKTDKKPSRKQQKRPSHWDTQYRTQTIKNDITELYMSMCNVG